MVRCAQTSLQDISDVVPFRIHEQRPSCSRSVESEVSVGLARKLHMLARAGQQSTQPRIQASLPLRKVLRVRVLRVRVRGQSAKIRALLHLAERAWLGALDCSPHPITATGPLPSQSMAPSHHSYWPPPITIIGLLPSQLLAASHHNMAHLRWASGLYNSQVRYPSARARLSNRSRKYPHALPTPRPRPHP
jgi:hypothetical protein